MGFLSRRKGVWEGRGEALSLCATAPRCGSLGLELAKIPTGQRPPGMLTPAPGTSGMVASRGSMAAWGGGHSQAGGSQRSEPVGGRGNGRGGLGLMDGHTTV